MCRFDLLKSALVTLAAVGLLLSPSRWAVAGQPEAPPAQPDSGTAEEATHSGQQRSPIQDVALQPEGRFRGQVLDAEGLSLDGAVVTVFQEGRQVARTVTDADGQFVFNGLSAGVYRVSAGPSSGFYRLWAPQTAPPAASQETTLVASGPAVRGQTGGGGLQALLTNPWVIGGVIATAIAVPVAVHNANIDDDDEPASP